MKRHIRIAGALISAIALMTLTAQAKDWQSDFAKASAQAKTENKYMLLDFTGSDWCGWCMKLDKEVFSTKEFKDYAEKALVLVVLDFPKSKPIKAAVKKQNAELGKKYEVEGYPTVILLTPEGEVAGKTGYQPGGPKTYIESLKAMIEKSKGAAAKAK